MKKRHDLYKNYLSKLVCSRWLFFVVVLIIYIVLSGMVSYTRYVNLETIIKYTATDYYFHTRLSAVVAAGYSPYSTTPYFYKTSVIIPREHCQYTGYAVLNALIMRVTGLGAEEVVYVFGPFLFNIILIFSIFIVCKLLEFNPNQAVWFLILYNFINDPNAIFTPTHAIGETIGNALGIIGVALFLKNLIISTKIKNFGFILTSALLLSFAVFLHVANIGFVIILVIYIVLSTLYSFIRKKKYLYNYKHLLILCFTGFLISFYILPIFTPAKCTLIIPYTDVGKNVVDPLLTPPPGITLTDLTVNSHPSVNSPFNISVKALNLGFTKENKTLSLIINGTVEETKEISLQSEETKTITFTVIKENCGHYVFSINKLKGYFDVSLSPPTIPLISIGYLVIKPKIVIVGEPITISVEVINRGGCTGKYTIILFINSTIEKTSIIGVDAGQSEIISFTVVKNETGKYYVDINKLTGTFEVVSEAPSDVLNQTLPDTTTFNYTPIHITTFSKYQEEEYLQWLRPQTVPNFILTFSYPLSYLYYGSTSRATIKIISNFVGYNLTNSDIENLTSLNLFSSPIPILLSLIYNSGVPLIFIMVITVCFKSKNNNTSLLVISAYLLIIFLTLFYLLFSVSFFTNRFIRYVVLFWSIIIVNSNMFSFIKKPISVFFILRSILWVLALSAYGGLMC